MPVGNIFSGFSGMLNRRRQGNPFGIGGGNTVLPPEAYVGGSRGYPTSTMPVGTGDLFRGSGSNQITYDTRTGQFSNDLNLPPAAQNISGALPDTGGAGMGQQTPRGTGQNIPLNDQNVMPDNQDFYYSGDASHNPLGGTQGGEDLSNAPMVTPDQYYDNQPITEWPTASSVPQQSTPPTAISPYPLPGGTSGAHPGFLGGLMDRLFGRGNQVTSSYDPSTGMNWVDSATNQGRRMPLDANGYPIPGGGMTGNAGNWAINASRPTPPWGSVGNANYVDPRSANSFFGGLINWNAGGFNPRSGEGDTGSMSDRFLAKHNIGGGFWNPNNKGNKGAGGVMPTKPL